MPSPNVGASKFPSPRWIRGISASIRSNRCTYLDDRVRIRSIGRGGFRCPHPMWGRRNSHRLDGFGALVHRFDRIDARTWMTVYESDPLEGGDFDALTQRGGVEIPIASM